MLDRIPTEEDWDNWKNDPPKDDVASWDRAAAKKNFLGKSIKETFSMFRSNFIAYMDDFYVMPRICFRYYIFSLAKYLEKIADAPQKSEFEFSVVDTSSAASCFFSFIEVRIKNDIEAVRDIFKELWPYVLKVANNQDKYAANLEIYGDFRLKAEEIKTLAQKAKIKI